MTDDDVREALKEMDPEAMRQLRAIIENVNDVRKALLVFARLLPEPLTIENVGLYLPALAGAEGAKAMSQMQSAMAKWLPS
jgi:hypothetical protein